MAGVILLRREGAGSGPTACLTFGETALKKSCDVVVVGAGPTGLVTSLLLAQAGHEVTVVERFAAPYPLPRAVCLSHESVRILHAAGVGDVLDDKLYWDERMRAGIFRTASGEVLIEQPFQTFAESGWPEMQCFDQPVLEKLLDECVRAHPRICLERGHSVTALHQSAEGVDIMVAVAGTEGTVEPEGASPGLRAAWVIGCDGANSCVRQAMNVAVTDLGFTWDWLVVDIEPTVERDWWPFIGQVLGPPRSVTWVPSGHGRRRFEFMLLPGETREEMGTAEVAWSLLADCGVDPSNAKLLRHVVYSFRALWADRWRDGRLLIAGDAAHLTPPFLGQGLNSGLRDAATLAWRLDLVLRGIAPPDTLDDYATERVAHLRDVIQEAVALGRLLCVVDPKACDERDAMLRRMRDAPGTHTPPPWRLGRGALAVDDEQAGLLGRQGVVRKGGRQDRFDEVCGSGRFVLLGRHGDPADELSTATLAVWQRLGGTTAHVAGDASVTDVGGIYEQWFAQTGSEVILVRPDFYVFGTDRRFADAERLVRELARGLHAEINESGVAEGPTRE